MKEIKECPVCRRKKFKLLETLSSEIQDFSIFQCLKCGLAFQNPMPTSRFLKKFYEGIYKKEYNLKSTETAFLKKDKVQEVMRLGDIEKYKKGGRILDVGASTGFFLSEVKKRKHWFGYGVEYSRKAVKIAKKKYGIELIEGELSHSLLPKNFFDVITMHSVVEHVPDPQDLLKQAHKKLKKGGLLVFNVPNISSFEYGVYKLLHKPFAGFIFEHLYYFTPKSINILLKKNRFKILTVTSYHHSSLSLPPKRPFMGILTFFPKLFLEYTSWGGLLKKGNIMYIYAEKSY